MGIDPGMGIHANPFLASSREEIPAACITGPAHAKAWFLNDAKTRGREESLRDPPSGSAA
jgi:hypothetical protein